MSRKHLLCLPAMMPGMSVNQMQPGVKLEHFEQSIQISWAALGAIAVVVLFIAALLVWMFSRKRDD